MQGLHAGTRSNRVGVTRSVGLSQFRCGTAGFSLVEIMIAMVLGLLLLQGALILFSSTNRVSATQAALSRIQENGRISLSIIGADLRQAGRMPCGSQTLPKVFTDTLSAHIVGAPRAAEAPDNWPANLPYKMDFSVLLNGNDCIGSVCKPDISAAQGLPKSGQAVGDRVPGTDVLTVRYLKGNGWSANGNGAHQYCDANEGLSYIEIKQLLGDLPLSVFKTGHIGLLGNCTDAEVFQVYNHDGELQPLGGKFGSPSCLSTNSTLRIFDLDTQFQTTSYFLQLVADDNHNGRKIAVLVRRVNGINNEVARGVERLDFRYSLIDADGMSHWLNAGEIDRTTGSAGEKLSCKSYGVSSPRQCGWSDVNAVDVSMLVNTVNDLPIESSAHAWDYRYSVDGDRTFSPASVMPVSGLKSGRMLRHEFQSVFALEKQTQWER